MRDLLRRPRVLPILLAVLVLALFGSAILLIMVARPPSYEPVPVPSVSRT